MLRKRLLLFVLICLTISVVHAQDTTTCTPASGTALRIGAVFPAQTLLMAATVSPYQGVVAMVQAVNACGGVDGHPVTLVSVPANNRDTARDAVAQLSGDVPLIIGSGSPAVSEVLLDESRAGKLIYWEVTEPLDQPHQWSFTPLPTNAQLGIQTADFIQSQVSVLLANKPLRLAIINEKRPAAQRIADSLTKALSTAPVAVYAYDNVLNDSYTIARQIREKKINVLVIIAFDRDTDQFWLSMRQADANLAAYIQVGGEPDRANICDRIGNTDGLITISRTGVVSDAYRVQQMGLLFDQYVAAYKDQTSSAPDQTADLAASGTYLLLHDVLPAVADNFTASNIQQAINSLQLSAGHGLMGEGFSVGSTSTVNLSSVAIVQQRQTNQLCSLVPSEIATCSVGLQDFPTWRERVSKPQFASCVD